MFSHWYEFFIITSLLVVLVFLRHQIKKNEELSKMVSLYTTFENIGLFAKSVVDTNSLFRQLSKEFVTMDCIKIDSAIVTHDNVTVAGGEQGTIIYRLPIEDTTRNQAVLVVDYSKDDRYKKFKPKGVMSSLHIPIKGDYVFNLYSSKKVFTSNVVRGIARIISTVEYQISNINSRMEAKITQILLGSMTEEIMLTDANGVIIRVNKAFVTDTGYTEDELLGKNPKLIQSGLHSKEYYRKMFSNLENNSVWSGDVINRKKDGTLCHKNVRVTKFEMNNSIYYLAVYNDLTSQKESSNQIEQLLKYDLLTKLPNRYNAQIKVPIMLEEAKLLNRSLAFIYIDLDKFGMINETYGYELGDKVMASVAERISKCFPDDLTVRYEGDEFLVLTKIGSRRDLTEMVMKVRNSFKQPIEIEDSEYSISISIGVSIYPKDGADAKGLIKAADLASYHAKYNVDGFVYYTTSMEQSAQKNSNLHREIRNAVANNEVGIKVQPYVNSEFKIVGYEVFASLPNLDMSTVDVIQVASDYGLLYDLGNQVLDKAFSTYLSGKQLSINISATQLESPTFFSELQSMLKLHNFNPNYLTLELTGQNPIKFSSYDTLTNLKELGISLIIDSFGMGYSNLDYLVDLPFNGIKLTGFHREDLRYNTLIPHLLNMCHALNLEVVIGNLSDLSDLDKFKGFKYAQGNCLHPAMTILKLAELCQSADS